MKRSPEQVAKIVGDIERTAYKKGWADAVEALSVSVAKMAASAGVAKTELKPDEPANKPKPKKGWRKKHASRFPKNKPRQLVLDAIRQNPGRIGSEIALLLASSVNKNTVRTQLRKLRIAGDIEQHDTRWYAKGAHRQVA